MRDATAYSVLLALVEPRFGPLSESERKLLQAASTGEDAICGPVPADPNAHECDPVNAQGWGPDRTIRT